LVKKTTTFEEENSARFPPGMAVANLWSEGASLIPHPTLSPTSHRGPKGWPRGRPL
jgi:hypothetical protein